MKVKFKYNRRYSMIITLSACAASLWLMINNFHFPAEEVLRIAAVCFVLVVPLIVIAALLGFILRKFNDRQLDQLTSTELNEATSEPSSPGKGGADNELDEGMERKVKNEKKDAIVSSENLKTEQEFNTENKTIRTSEETNHS